MPCHPTCPFIPRGRYIDWDLPYPRGEPIETVGRIRDEIAKRIRQLATESEAYYTGGPA
jgi:arsenate reductase (thioredoxin)